MTWSIVSTFIHKVYYEILLSNESGEGLDNLDDLTEALPEEEEAGVKDDDDDMDFNDDSFGDKKKKKKKKKVNVDDLDDGDADKVWIAIKLSPRIHHDHSFMEQSNFAPWKNFKLKHLAIFST